MSDKTLFSTLWMQLCLTPRFEESTEQIEVVINLLSELNEKNRRDPDWADFVRAKDDYVQFFRRLLRDKSIDAQTFRKFIP